MRRCAYPPHSAIFPWVIHPDNLRTLYIEIYRVKFVSGLFLENHWLDFNKTLWEASLPRGDTHIAGFAWFHNLTQSYFSWLVTYFVYSATFVSGLFLENCWMVFNETLWEASLPSGDAHIACVTRFHNLTQNYFPYIYLVHFVYRATFISGLFLENYWLDFNKTL